MNNAPTELETRAPAELAYRSIREQILSGEQPGGEWLRESDLAAAIGVSRTPVREALRRLEAEGLVKHERNRGAQVQSWAFKDLEDLFALRSLLEPWGCALTAANGTVSLEALDALSDAMADAATRQPPDLDLITELNAQFHGMIMEASGNSRLLAILESLVQTPFVWRTFSHYTPDELQRSLAQHRELVSALRTGDPLWAEAAMRSHLRSAWSTISREAHVERPPVDLVASDVETT